MDISKSSGHNSHKLQAANTLQVRLNVVLGCEGLFSLLDLSMALGHRLRTLEFPLSNLLDVHL